MSRADSARSSGTHFAILEPRIRHVSQNVIKKRWKKLSPGVQEDIRSVLLSLKQTSSLPKDRRIRTISALENCVDDITNKLIERLPRMPFPPSTHEETFDYELTLQRIHQSEEQLDANMNSVNLLRIQVKQEQQLLEQDQSEATQLKRNLRASEGLRNQQTKTLHVVAQEVPMSNIDDAEKIHHRLRTSQHDVHACSDSSVTTLAADPDVAPLLALLRNHLESIQGNAGSLRAVVEATTDTDHAMNVCYTV